MLKTFLKISFFIFVLLSPSYGNVINNIEIIGNKRISKETILVLGNIQIGKEASSSELNNILKELYKTDFFSDVQINFDENILKINIKENPIIEKITITGIKKKSFTELIYEEMSLKDRMSFTDDQLKNDLNLINSILKTSGYYFANLKVSQKKDEQLNSVNLNIDIDLGEKAKIKKISFIGDKKIKDKKLLELIASEEHKFWKFITNKVYLNQSLIELDKRLLENYYKNNGYYKVEILNSFAELNNDGFFKLTFNINAGQKYYFNNLTLELPTDYDPKDFKNIQDLFVSLENEQYSLNNLNLILSEIDEIASLRLYDFISIDVDESVINENKINFIFKIKDSEKFYVEKINILGNFNTIEEVIRNKLIVDEGDPYNELLFNKSINNLRSLGIFKSVNSEIIDGSTTNTKVLNLSVEEKPTGEISLGAGYGTDGGVIGGGLTEKNFLGKGINLDSDLQISNDGIKGSITYSKPNFNYTDNTLFTSVKSTTQDSLANYGYKINTAGFSVGTRLNNMKIYSLALK